MQDLKRVWLDVHDICDMLGKHATFPGILYDGCGFGSGFLAQTCAASVVVLHLGYGSGFTFCCSLISFCSFTAISQFLSLIVFIQGDHFCEHKRRQRLEEYDKCLKLFEYGNALDAALKVSSDRCNCLTNDLGVDLDLGLFLSIIDYWYY